jgi:hypothetical protein
VGGQQAGSQISGSKYKFKRQSELLMLVAGFLGELLFLRDDCLVFSNNVTHDELEKCIYNICTIDVCTSIIDNPA